ncbi:MAG: M20/M25/M40 family metallo-hydrolase, partial [Gemmatimonadota bacterium]|nr:M20/M25/M40 family metallo-hydrolase [Gemmatimonadota bacterium]
MLFRRAALLLPLALLPAPASLAAQTGAEAAVEAARAWREAHGAEILAEYRELLAIPNVARDLPNIRRNARAIADAFEARGARMEILTLPEAPEAPPVVWGTLPVEGAERTLVLYVHYDGQPVDRPRWTATEPWEPALYSGSIERGAERIAWPEADAPVDPEWRIYARSAGDDKAPLAAILGALDALEAAGVARRANLVFFFEGEEEAGSPHLADYVDRYADRLGSDAWLFLDGPVHQSGRPQLFFGVRGYTGLDVTVYGATRYLHSGHYGNWAPNPAERLAALLASMQDDEGRVTVEGFYDTVEPLSKAEREAIAEIPPFEEELERELGLAESEGEGRYAERIALPSLNVRGMAGGTVGETARNVIPPEATASIDVRLVAGNDPEAMLDRVEAHVRSRGWHVVREEPDRETRLVHPRIARIDRRPGYRAVKTSMEGAEARRVIAAARAASPREVVLLPTLGGSLPLYVFEDRLGAPLVGVPIANHDDNQHAPDENL